MAIIIEGTAGNGNLSCRDSAFAVVVAIGLIGELYRSLARDLTAFHHIDSAHNTRLALRSGGQLKAFGDNEFSALAHDNHVTTVDTLVEGERPFRGDIDRHIGMGTQEGDES